MGRSVLEQPLAVADGDRVDEEPEPSSRSLASSQRTVVALPDMPMSPSTASLNRRTASTSPGRTVKLFQVGFSSELEMTYFGMLLK